MSAQPVAISDHRWFCSGGHPPVPRNLECVSEAMAHKWMWSVELMGAGDRTEVLVTTLVEMAPDPALALAVALGRAANRIDGAPDEPGAVLFRGSDQVHIPRRFIDKGDRNVDVVTLALAACDARELADALWAQTPCKFETGGDGFATIRLHEEGLTDDLPLHEREALESALATYARRLPRRTLWPVTHWGDITGSYVVTAAGATAWSPDDWVGSTLWVPLPVLDGLTNKQIAQVERKARRLLQAAQPVQG